MKQMEAITLKNGTYTFTPAIQAQRGTLKIAAYLDRVVALNGYLIVYISGAMSADFGSNYNVILQELDHPSIQYGLVKWGYAEGDSRYCAFQVPQGTRFKLYNTSPIPESFTFELRAEPTEALPPVAPATSQTAPATSQAAQATSQTAPATSQTAPDTTTEPPPPPAGK
jgi:hypothetical protein